MSWNPIGDAPANPYEIVEASSNYTIQNGELVFAESGVELTFPQPEPDGAIGVASVDGKSIELVPQSGEIESEEERKYNKTEVSYFVSDGTDWYAVSNRELLSAIPNSVIYYPEDNDLNEFSGDTGSYSIETTNALSDVADGRRLAAGTEAGWLTLDEGIVGSPLPEPGDIFACYAYEIGNDDPQQRIAFGLQDSSGTQRDGYAVSFRPSTNNIRLVKNPEEDSAGSIINDSTPDLDTDTWYDVEIEWASDGDITVTTYDVDQTTGERQSEVDSFTGNDDDYGAGEVGHVYSSSSGEFAWQYYRIVEQGGAD